MCKRQIDRRPTPPAPSNDNGPKVVPGPTGGKPTFLKPGILSAVLERTDRVRLDFVADGVLTIRGERLPAHGLSALH